MERQSVFDKPDRRHLTTFDKVIEAAERMKDPFTAAELSATMGYKVSTGTVSAYLTRSGWPKAADRGRNLPNLYLPGGME